MTPEFLEKLLEYIDARIDFLSARNSSLIESVRCGDLAAELRAMVK